MCVGMLVLGVGVWGRVRVPYFRLGSALGLGLRFGVGVGVWVSVMVRVSVGIS